MHYLQLQDLVPEENVKWIDTINGIFDATRDFSSEESGLENLLVYMWKPTMWFDVLGMSLIHVNDRNFPIL